MNNQTLSDLLSNTVVIFLLQVAIFSLPPFYIATLRRPLRSVAFYTYASIVLVIGGFLGSVYSIPLTESITISGGNLAYGALLYTTILLVMVEGDVFVIRNVVRLVITVNVLKYIFFSIISWSLSLTSVLNPFETAPDLFAVSIKFMTIGGVLIITELLIMLFLFEQIKTRVRNFYAQFVLFVVSFIAVLLLDGILFPLLAFGIASSLVSIVVGGITGKFIMAAAYSLPLLVFFLIFRDQIRAYIDTPIGLKEILTASREELLEEINRQQKSIMEKDDVLYESEERLRLALKAANQGLYDLNLQTGNAQVNAEYALMLGYDPDTFVETNAKWMARIHPDDRERVQQFFQAYVAGDIPEYRVDFRQKTKTGDWLWIASLGKIVSYDQEGKPLRMLGTHTDITERKQSERKLLESQSHFRALLESAQGFAIYRNRTVLEDELQGRVIFVSPSIREIMGVSDPHDISTWFENIHPDDYPRVLQAQIDSSQKSIPFNQQMQIYHPIKQEWRWIHAMSTPTHESEDGHTYFNGIIIDITAQKHAEQTLEERENFLQAIFDNSLNAIMVADDTGNYLSVNQSAADMFGYPVEKLLQMSVSDLQTARSPGAKERYQQYLATGKEIGEFDFIHPNGEDRVAQYHAVRVDENFNLSILVDITERKLAEQALSAKEAQYRNLVETSHDLIWAIDVEGRITFMNQASQRIYGRSPEEMIGQLYTDFIPPKQIEINAQSWAAAIENSDRITNFDNWVLHKDGTPVCLSANAVLMRDEQGNIVGSMGTSQDITERIEKERQLQYQAFLLDNVSDAIISTDLNFNVLTWNQAAERLYGWPAENVIGKHLNAIIPVEYPHDDADTVVQQFFQEGVWQGEVIQADREGRKHAILSSVTLLKDEAGAPVGAVAVNRDISERKAAQEKQKELLQQIRLAIDSAQLGLWELDLATNHLQWNDQQLTIYGISREEFESDLDGWRSQVHQEDQAFADGRLGEVFAGKSVFDVPFRIIWPSGEIRYINASATPVFNNVGEIVKLIGINMDVTTAKVRENALRESEARLQQRNQFIETILDNLPIGLAVNNIDQGTATYMNAAFEEIYGWPREKLSDIEQFFQCVYPDLEYRRQIQAQIIDDIASGDPERMSWEEIHISTEQGEKRIISAKNIPIPEQNFMISTVQDITKRKMAEEQINRTQLLLKEMGSIAKIGGWELDMETMEPTFTEETFRIYELPPTEPPKLEDGISYYPPESRPLVEKAVQAAITENLPYDIEVPFITAKGRHIWVRTQGRVHVEGGKAVRLFGSIQDITDRKVAEERLGQQEEFLSSLLESAPVSIYVIGDDDKLRLVNPVWEADTGQPRTIALGQRLDQLFSPDVARKFSADNQSVIETGVILMLDEEIEQRIFHTVKSPLRNANGQIDGIVGISVDITARVQAERQLQEYTQRLEVLHQIDRAILAQDSSERIAEVTVDHLAKQIACDFISAGRFDEGEATALVLAAHVRGTTQLGQGMRIPIPDHDHGDIMAGLRQGKTRLFPDLNPFAGQGPSIDALLQMGLRSYMMAPLITADRLIGSLILGSVHVNQFDETHETLVREVADQLSIALQQAYLHETERAQRALAETLQATAVTLVGSLNLEETLDTILTQLALVVPYDLAQTLLIRGEMLAVGARQGRLAADLVEEGERPYTQIPLLNQSLQSGKPVILTVSQIQENHLNLPGMVPDLASWVGIPLVARGVAVGFLTVGQIDAQYLPQQINAITAFAQQAALAIEKATILLELENSVHTLRETQAQLVRAARLSAIGETAAGVAHQINNPLTTVIVDSHLLLKNLPAAHAARPSAEAIHQAALRAASVVERLLDFSRTQPTAKSPVNISDSLNESVTILKAQIPENVRIELDLQPDLPLVAASPEHLQDVWLNLLLNARDAVIQLEKGSIRVTVTHNIRYNRIEVSIQDNGMGIPHDEQQNIFNPFYTTKPRGTGLGLAVCQDIILHHDGEIRVRSVEGEGSVFTVMLPL